MANGTPKPLSLVQGHRSKAEIETREQGEKAITTTIKFNKWPDVKKNKLASDHFDKLEAAFTEIGMTDVLCEAVLNRYCLLLSECSAIEKSKDRTQKALNELYKNKAEMEFLDFICNLKDLNNILIAQDKLLAKKRDQLLLIEKENVMTVQGKLRAVPKKPLDETEDDPLARLAASRPRVQ